MPRTNPYALADRALRRELAGPEQQHQRHVGPALGPTPELQKRVRVKLAKVAEHLAAQHRIVPRIEEPAAAKKFTPNMIQAARYYACLAFIADGPSVGVSRYGDWEQASPAWSRAHTTDERLQARALFEKARFAAFGLIDRSGDKVLNDQVRHAIEPVLLGDDQCLTFGQIGEWLSTYESRKGNSAAGTQEVVAVLRRLRDFFRLGDDGGR